MPFQGHSQLSLKGHGTEKVSEDWKTINVTPIFKKSKKENPENHRLLSLTLIPGKVMEKLILETVSKHMKYRKVIRSSQNGFRKTSHI